MPALKTAGRTVTVRRPRRRRRPRPPPREPHAPHPAPVGRVFAKWPAAIGATLFLGATLAYGVVIGGHTATVGRIAADIGNSAARFAGVAAEEIVVTGLERGTRDDIYRAIDVYPGDSLIGFDAGEARDRLQALDWVAEASVRRVLPGRLLIEVTERIPYAIWQHGGEFVVIDRKGVAMSSLPVREHLSLPVVVGNGANEHALDLLNQLEAWPGIKSRVRAAVRVADRRWNLLLRNGIYLHLPEGDISQAMNTLSALDTEQALLSRDVVSIDMRLDGRMVVRLNKELADQLGKTLSGAGTSGRGSG